MNKWIATVLVVLYVLSLGVIAGTADSSYRIFFYKTYEGVVPLGVFKHYVIGYRIVGDSTEIIAIDMFNDSIHVLGLAETLGLELEKTVFWETNEYFMLADTKTVVIWDKELRQLGRHTQDELKGATVLPDGHLVAWSRDVVLVSTPPWFVYSDIYDVWEIVYNHLVVGDLLPEEALVLTGYNVDEIKNEIINEILSVIAGVNGELISGPNITMRYDFSATTPTDLRTKLIVDIVTAGLIKDKLYVAVSVEVPIIIVEGKATYMVKLGNATGIEEYCTYRIYGASFGLLLEVDTMNDTSSILRGFHNIEAGSSSSIIALVYEPLLNESTVPRMLLLLLEDGTQISAPIYASSSVREIYLVGNFELVRTDAGTLIVYRRGIFVEAFLAKTINDVGMTRDGKVYIVYRNQASALELGFIDEYSGRYRKYVVETSIRVVGAHVSDKLLFIVGDMEGSTRTEIAVREPLATLLIKFTDPYGNKLAILRGIARISYGDLLLDLEFNSNPLILVMPPGSHVNITVHVPYGGGSFTYNVDRPGRFEYIATVPLALAPGVPEATSVSRPFYNPFFREYAVIRDTETLKYRLPGAMAIDAYGSLLALVEAPGTNTTSTHTTISVYNVNGVKLYSILLPGTITEVKFYYPYLVARGSNKLYVLDALTGSLKGEIGLTILGYDVDVINSYVVAWSSSKIAVLDLRHQTITYLDMTRHGVVMTAPILNGIVYAYVSSPNNTSRIYVINPITKGIVDILPWNGRKVISFVSDGRFHVISYETIDGTIATDILSHENGITRLDDGPVVWVRTLGSVVNIPGHEKLRGNLFAALVVRKLNVIRVYITGLNTVLVHEIKITPFGDLKLSLNYMAEAIITPNATPLIVLRDYSGTPRIVVVASNLPLLLAVSENLVAYGNAEVVYMLPNPKVIGKYHILVRVYDDQGNPLDARIYLKEFGVEAEAKGGVFKTYLSTPGTYHIIVRADYFREEEVNVTVSDQNPAVEVSVQLEPALFTLVVNVVTPDGERVREGVLTIKGIDNPFEATIDLSEQEPLVNVRKGSYSIVFSSDIYAEAETVVDVYRDMEITLLTNRTNVRILVRVVDEADMPVANAEVVVESPMLPSPIEVMVNESGETSILLPYGITVNITALHPDYMPTTTSLNVTEAVEKTPIVLKLVKPRIIVTVILQDEEGNPETATVTIRDASGNIVDTLQGFQTVTIELEPGTYVFEGITEDGRTASTTIILTPDMEFMSANLVFPKKPIPFYIKIFPYLLIAVVAASIAIIVYKKFFRKPKPRKVG